MWTAVISVDLEPPEEARGPWIHPADESGLTGLWRLSGSLLPNKQVYQKAPTKPGSSTFKIKYRRSAPICTYSRLAKYLKVSNICGKYRLLYTVW